MTFEEHVAEGFRAALHDADLRISEELGESHGRMILHLRNHAATLTPDQCRKMWIALSETLALPRYMRE